AFRHPETTHGRGLKKPPIHQQGGKEMNLKFTKSCLMAAMLGATALAPVSALAAKTELSLGAGAEDIGRLDPHYAASTIDRTLVAWIFGALVRFKPGTTDPGLIEPDLAESWDVSDDGLVWTFHLRDD